MTSKSSRSVLSMEEYKAALLAFKQVVELYYDTEFIELAHLKTIACYIKKNDFETASNYYASNRIQIEDIMMDLSLIHI